MKEGLASLKTRFFDVVILDANLPDSKGLEAFKKVNEHNPHVPVIVIDKEESDLAIKTIREGAQDCLAREEIDSNLLVRSIKYAIERKRAELELKNSFANFQHILEETINTLSAIVEMRDPFTAGHQRKVAGLAQVIAREMNLTEEQTKSIRLAALIHDVGKTRIPEEILKKPERLTDKERDIIKIHPGAGAEILKAIEFPWLITQIVIQHHERLDGSGYPKGLIDKDILLESKILAVADVVEAMCSHRPYRPAMSIEVVLEELKDKKGILYDPAVVDACINLFKEKSFKFD